MAHKQLDNFSCEANRKNGSTAAVDTDITWHDIDRSDPPRILVSCPPDFTESGRCPKAKSSSDWIKCRIWTSPRNWLRRGRRSDLVKSIHPTHWGGEGDSKWSYILPERDVLTLRSSLVDWIKLGNISTLGQQSQCGNLITIIPYQRHFPRDPYFRSHNTWNLKSCTSGLESVGTSDIRY